jgi:hypothetical protein
MSFNFGNKFLRMPVAPPVDPGGGGGGGPIMANIYHAPENSYIDQVSGYGIGQNEYVIDIDSGFGYINYIVNTINGVVQSPEKKITTNSGSGTESAYIPLTGTSWTYVSGTPNVRFQRPFAGFGIQKDKVYWNGSLNATYQYILLQKSIVSTRYATLDISENPDVTTILTPGVIIPVTVNTLFQLDKSFCRGDEVSSTWTILKTDPAGTFASIPAVSGVDYLITTGTITSDLMKLKFLTNYNFEVKVNIAGYTFASNPYLNYPAQIVPNTAAATYYFNTAAPTVTYEIKIPTITAVATVPSAVQIGTNPLETYQNQLIDITSTIDISSGYWKKIEGVTTTLLTKSETEWRTEIESSCDVTLEARDKVTNELIFTRIGLGPFTVSFGVVSSYNLQFKTILK